MKTIRMKVENNVLTILPEQDVKQIVCGNDCYQIEVEFDSEWQSYSNKKARFIANGVAENKSFTGNVCAVPKLSKTSAVMIGIFAEDDEAATTALVFPCLHSVLCVEVKEPEEPEVEMITFTLTNDLEGGSYEFSCPEGMTFIDLASSEYKTSLDGTASFTVEWEEVAESYMPILITPDHGPRGYNGGFFAEDVIVANREYLFDASM